MTSDDLDPVIHQATRLKVMVALMKNREASATALRDGLGLTDGNLASHVGRLEAAGYIVSRRVLTADGFQVRHRITPGGSDAFKRYAASLERLVAAARPLGETKQEAGPGDRPAPT